MTYEDAEPLCKYIYSVAVKVRQCKCGNINGDSCTDCNANQLGDWRGSTCEDNPIPPICQGQIVLDPDSKNPVCGPDFEAIYGKLRCPDGVSESHICRKS